MLIVLIWSLGCQASPGEKISEDNENKDMCL